MRKKLIFSLLMLKLFVLYTQDSVDNFFYEFKTLDKTQLQQLIKQTSHNELSEIFKIQFDLYHKGDTDIILSNLNEKKHNIDSITKALYLMTEADLMNHRLIGSDSLIFKKYQEALKIADNLDHKVINCEIIKRIFIIISQNQHLISKYPDFLNRYKKNIYDNYELVNYNLLQLAYQFHFSSVNSSLIPEFKKNLALISDKENYEVLKARHYRLIGMNYDIFLKKYDSAFYYHQKSIDIYNKHSSFFMEDESFSSYINQGIVLHEKRDFLSSLKILKKAIKINIRKDKLYNKVLAFDWIAKNYKALKQADSALYYFEKKLALNDSLNYMTNAENINYLQTKFETAEKEKENLELKNKNLLSESRSRKNQNIAIGLGGSLFLGSIIAILIYRSTKRKQRIAEQEREIEIQKTEKLLKDQELTAIDAMISGQEKERQRLANDLHDNLGSTLATVKLHFDHLKNNHNNPKAENIEELYSKTNNLLDEAYQKVRSIAHEKNSGVMANQGLLPAIKKLAAKASNGNQLQIDVQDYGLDERLDNALEISIFRMIQELITNVIKHANASEINISLTNHDSLLNIIIEDNGKGFNAQVLPEKDGMGLKSIEKRVEHMEGTFEIDSTIGKGTNIIINIPI